MYFTSIVSYPFEEDGPTQMLIGGVLTLLGVLLLPLFIVFGYYYEVMHDTIKGKTVPPKFTTDNIVRLSIKGVGVFSILIVYGIIWLGVVSMSFIILEPPIGAAAQGDLDPQPIFIVLIIGGITAAILGYLANASFISYTANDSIVSAFSPKNIITIILSGRYLIMNLILGIFTLMFFIVSFIISEIPIIGQIVSPFILFPVFVIIWHALGTVGNDLSEEIA